ncbi:lipopolysaccharide biosynthesis protein [Paucibacter sp. B51]|uniref:lipopolysaccharide biosynthesis protein n=1 Tax=Paucibacter sp. B51 TaxID=2993315 RepID=UPI0022EBDB64|nr:lipopolysaccharide biosynthesis protein [Paucibacter sp. B51]
MTELARQSVTAAKWGLFSSVAKFVMQLLVNIAIARLLGPDAYGLFALATIGLLVATFLSEVGLGWSLMQRETLDDEVIRFVFTWQCLSGLVGLLFMLLAAEAMAEFLRDPRLAEVMRWLGLCCLLNGVAATATNLLRREMRFRELAQVQLLSYLLAYVLVGLPMAFLGHGVWSMVSAWVLQSVFGLFLSYRARPHPLRLRFRTGQAREFFDLGATVLLTNLCNWALTNADRLILGRIAGTQAAGLYAVGYNLATVPNSLMISALQPAFLASGARLQDDLPRLAKGYREVQSFIWIVLAPLFAILAVAGTEVIAVLYGPAWQSSGLVFVFLAAAMPAYLAWALSTPVLWNTGRKRLEMLLQLPLLVLALPAFYAAASRGSAAVAAVAGLLFLARYLVTLLPAWRALDLSATAWAGMFLHGLLACAVVAAPGLLLAAPLQTLPAWLAGMLKASACLIVWLLIVLVWPKMLGQAALSLLQRFMPKGSALGRAWAKRCV